MENRREFIKKGSSAMAYGLLAAALPFDQIIAKNAQATTEPLRMGVIGCRSMGTANVRDFIANRDVECTAICDLDPEVMEKMSQMIVKAKGKKPDQMSDYRQLIQRDDIDLVVISTPDHWHCLQMVEACAAGKDVYVEKPIANSIAECDAMVKAARKYNRVVSVGQQQRSAKHWQEVIDYVHSGRLGRIMKVDVWANFKYAALGLPSPDEAAPKGIDYNEWLGPAPERRFNPNRFHGKWRMFWDYGGGLMTDWGVHLLDIALWGMKVEGMPQRVVGCGGKMAFPNNAPETFDTLNVTYEFDQFLINWSNVAGVESGPFGRHYGVAFKGTNGTLVANREGWEVIPDRLPNGTSKIEALQKKSEPGDHRQHVRDFLDCVKKRQMETACTIENGSLCAKYAHLGNIAARTSASLTYDDKRKTFNHKEADKLIAPSYRKGYTLPKL